MAELLTYGIYEDEAVWVLLPTVQQGLLPDEPVVNPYLSLKVMVHISSGVMAEQGVVNARLFHGDIVASSQRAAV